MYGFIINAHLENARWGVLEFGMIELLFQLVKLNFSTLGFITWMEVLFHKSTFSDPFYLSKLHPNISYVGMSPTFANPQSPTHPTGTIPGHPSQDWLKLSHASPPECFQRHTHRPLSFMNFTLNGDGNKWKWKKFQEDYILEEYD